MTQYLALFFSLYYPPFFPKKIGAAGLVSTRGKVRRTARAKHLPNRTKTSTPHGGTHAHTHARTPDVTASTLSCARGIPPQRHDDVGVTSDRKE